MNWVLLMIWTANFVTTSQQISFESQELCEAARAHLVETWTPNPTKSDTKLQTFCLQTKTINFP